MAETAPTPSLGEALASLIQALSNKPGMEGKSAEDLKLIAEKQMRDKLEARAAEVKKRADDRIAKKAKEWADTVKHEGTRKVALDEVEKAKYPDGLTLGAASGHVADTEVIVGAPQPDWLKTSIHESPQAVELVARVTQLSPELQNDPNVLYLELAKLNKSMNWVDATPAARHEARVVQDKMLARIAEVAKTDVAFGDANRDALLEIVDPERIHLKTISEIPAVGEEPEKFKKKEHEAWVEKKVDAAQAENLKNKVETAQEVFDFKVNESAENQRNQLQEFVKSFQGDITRVQHLSGVDGNYTGLKRADAIGYIESAQAKIEKLDPIVETQRQNARAVNDVKRSVESGHSIQWNKDLQNIYKHHDHAEGETIDVGYRLTPDDVNEIVYGGIAGQRRWLARFREKYIGTTGEPFKPGLDADMQFQEFRKITTWLNGSEHVALTLQYQDLWELYQDVDSITKGVLYRPAGPKSEESFNTLRYLKTTHHEMLRGYDYVDIAKPAVSEAIEDVMRDQLAFYQKNLDALQEAVPGYDRRVDKFIALRKKYEQSNDYKELQALRENKKNPKRLKELEDKFIGKSEQYGGLSQADYNEMQEIDTMIDNVGRGVLLRDDQMKAHVAPYRELNDLFYQYTQHDGNRDDLMRKMQEKWREFTLNDNAVFNPETDGDLLMELRNFSPVEIRAYDRVVQTLRSDWIHKNGSLEGFDKFLKDDSYKVRDAVWAAQTIVVGMGEAMEKGAKMGRSPRFDLEFTLGLPKEIKTKHFMDRGFAEAYQRVMNPYLFEEDFHMGSKMGEVARNINYEMAFNEVGYDYKKDPSMPKEWKDKVRRAERGTLFADGDKKEVPVPVWVVYAQYAQENLGMSFDQIMRPDLLATGLQQLATYWRLQKFAYEPIMGDYLKTKTSGESPEYQAMGIALASLSETNVGARMPIMKRMLERKPSIFIKLIGKDLDTILKSENVHPGTIEWKSFQDTLALMEMELWRNQEFKNKPYDLTDKSSFIALAKRALAGVDPTLNSQQIADKSERYFNVIDKVQHYMKEPSVNGKSRLENWASHKVDKMLLFSSSDFDWKKTDFSRMGDYALERRINDFQAQKRAEEARREILTKEKFLTPAQGKEGETLEEMELFKEEVINYAGDDTAEVALSALLNTVVEFNRNRAIHTPAGWIPGAVSLMKRANMMGEDLIVTVDNMPKFIGKPIKDFLEETKLAGRPLDKWPRSISEAVSYAVSLGGHEQNAWDEYRVAGFLAAADHLMLFQKKPELLAKMRNKFKTGFLWRSLGVVRKYWWVVPVATLVVAMTDEMEEEKKGRH